MGLFQGQNWVKNKFNLFKCVDFRGAYCICEVEKKKKKEEKITYLGNPLKTSVDTTCNISRPVIPAEYVPAIFGWVDIMLGFQGAHLGLPI
jgi:hypothetical protein